MIEVDHEPMFKFLTLGTLSGLKYSLELHFASNKAGGRI